MTTKRRRKSPYQFLASYGPRDSDRFFGRDLETDLLLSDIVVSRLVVLFAKTGTGKTSLINAGVRPRLHERRYKTYLVRVRDEDPFVSTRAALRKQAPKHFPGEGSLADQLRSLATNVKRPIVLFFDQFEEFFLYTLSTNITAASEFVATIAELYDDADSGVHVVFSLREEWFVDMGFFRDRIPAIFHTDSNLRLRWFTKDQARDAIVKPAGEEAYEPKLVETLVKELAATSGAIAPTPSPGDIEPAQLQIVCDTLWGEKANGAITLEDYVDLGDAERNESVAQQILDRRLVQEFKDLDREQLELLIALLPELKTDKGTKRVREYDDLVSSLLSSAAVPSSPVKIRALLEHLRDHNLLDILPRESGEIVELTHDYLVTRLDELGVGIATIWPKRVLDKALPAFRKKGELLHSTVIVDVLAAAPSLSPGPNEGELLLRSALGHLADPKPLLSVLERSGAPVWEIFLERLVEGPDAERALVVATLVSIDSSESLDVLRQSLDDPRAAAQVATLLGRWATASAVDLLDDARGKELCAEEAEAALAELAGNPAHPEVAARANDSLKAAFGPRLADPVTAGETITRLMRLDSRTSVELLTETLGRPELEILALSALQSLTLSTDRAVAAAARQAVVAHVERTLSEGRTEPWAVEALEVVGSAEAVELLGRLLDTTPLADTAAEALRRLQRSERTEVATAATRTLDRKTAPPPEPDAPEPVPPSMPSQSSVLLESHFDIMLRLLANGRVVPFLGHGSALADRPSGVSWTPGLYPPTLPELADHLAAAFDYPEGEPRDLQRIAEYVTVFVGRAPLYQELREVFDADFPATGLHRFLATLPRRFEQRSGLAQVIVTTAWDDSLERAFAEANEPVEVLSYIADGPSTGLFLHRRADGTRIVLSDPALSPEIESSTRTIILRLHGGIDRSDPDQDSFVISDQDRLEFGTRAAQGFSFLPIAVSKLLIQTSFLFLGFSLHDWSTRILLNSLERERRTSQPSWSIQWSPTKLEVELWRHRRVEVLDVSLDEYVPELERRLFEFDVRAVPA